MMIPEPACEGSVTLLFELHEGKGERGGATLEFGGTGWGGGDGRDRRACPLRASWCKHAGQCFQTIDAFLELVPLSIQAEEFVCFGYKARA